MATRRDPIVVTCCLAMSSLYAMSSFPFFLFSFLLHTVVTIRRRHCCYIPSLFYNTHQNSNTATLRTVFARVTPCLYCIISYIANPVHATQRSPIFFLHQSSSRDLHRPPTSRFLQYPKSTPRHNVHPLHRACSLPSTPSPLSKRRTRLTTHPPLGHTRQNASDELRLLLAADHLPRPASQPQTQIPTANPPPPPPSLERAEMRAPFARGGVSGWVCGGEGG